MGVSVVGGNWRHLVAAALVLAAAGCGWVEVGEREDQQAGDTGRPTRLPVPVPRPLPPEPTEAVSVAELKPLARQPARVTVAPGDTVEAIALRHDVSVSALVEANRLRPPYALSAGQMLTLPKEPEHTVRQSETLFGIARLYGLDPYALAMHNGLTRPYEVRPGQRLRLPAAGTTAPEERDAEPEPPPSVIAGLPAAPAALPQPPERSDEGFVWPVKGRIISRFGPKGGGLHNDGINIAVKEGTPVRAVENGVVAYAGNELRAFGNLVLVKHEGGWVSAYAHNAKLLVNRGDKVKKGQVIAHVGSSGGVSEPQLHFELRKGRSAVDPLQYLGKAGA